MRKIAAVALSAVIAVWLSPALSAAESVRQDRAQIAARENQDVQAPREHEDVQAPRENQNGQAPRVSADTSRTPAVSR